jgi:hypothetical protein
MYDYGLDILRSHPLDEQTQGLRCGGKEAISSWQVMIAPAVTGRQPDASWKRYWRVDSATGR